MPGSAETSLVMTMITGALCEARPRMPPPPRTALTAEQIEVIRAWIGAGAPLGAVDSGASDGGSDVADVSADNAKDVSIDVVNEAPQDVSLDPTNDTGGDPTNDTNGDESNDDAMDETTNDDVTGDAGSDIADDPPTGDADACNGARNLRPNLRSLAPSLGPIRTVCTDTMPCGAGLMCLGNSCADEWSCIPHLQPSEHPCPPDNVPHCGCDGVTFMSPTTCEDRPWIFVGACEGGVSCDASAVPCGELPPPTCAAGQVPSVVDGRYGYCVDIKYCRCDAIDATPTKCPAPSTCNASTKRCTGPTRDQ